MKRIDMTSFSDSLHTAFSLILAFDPALWAIVVRSISLTFTPGET
jgi:hypothetical protein